MVEADPRDAHSEMHSLMREWSHVPALIRDRHLTVLASNPLAKALSPSFVEGVNLVRFTFVDSAREEGKPCWAEVTAQVASMLRESLEVHADDAPFRGLVGELSAKSPRFSETWADDSHPSHTGTATFVHDVVGAVTLSYRERWLGPSRERALMVWSARDEEAGEQLSRISQLA